MTTKQRYDGVIAWFSEHMPVAESELHYTDPYQLLVAVILSAQCTDKRVNMTTPALFEAFPTPFDMAAATAEENAVIGRARQLLGAYDRAELMIQSGLYAPGSDPVVDAAISVWPKLDAFLAEDELDDTAASFARLAKAVAV